MKKILYSLMAVAGLMTTSCISFDDPVTENYGVGPTATITVTEATDSAFTFTVNPGENALYYSILVDQSADTAAVDAESLLKGTYSSVFNVVKNTNDSKTFTYNMRKADGTPICEPGKTYQIYAVAATDKGVLGEVAVATANTTDQLAPKVLDYEYDAEEKAMYVLFSENVKRGEGAVIVKSYKYNDLLSGNFAGEVIPAEEVIVETSEDVIAIVVPTSYAGAYLTFSWEAGAFVDEVGHACEPLNTVFNTAVGDFDGLYVVNETEAFEVVEDNVMEPALGSTIENASEFFGTFTFDMNVYAGAGTVTITYSNAESETSYKLTKGTHWDVDANSFIFVLPDNLHKASDKISIKLSEGVITDAYGNPNAEVEFKNAWTMSAGIKLTDADFNGVFAAMGVSAYDNQPVNLGENIYVYSVPELDESVPEGCKAVGIENFILDGSVILGYYDLTNLKFAIAAFYKVGLVELTDGTVYGSITYSLAGNDWIVFDINSEGVFETDDLGWVACDTEYTSALGWLDKFSITQMVKTGELPTQAPTPLKKKFETNPYKFSAKNLPFLKK